MKEGLAKTVLSILLGVLAGLCLASVVILIVYGRYYQDRVRANTTLNQDNISNMTRDGNNNRSGYRADGPIDRGGR